MCKKSILYFEPPEPPWNFNKKSAQTDGKSDLAAPTGLSDSHVRFHSMGPFRYVRFKLRQYGLFSPTYAPNLRFSSRWEQAKIKTTRRWFEFLAAQVKTNANTIIQEIINIAEMLTDADIALYHMPDCDSAQQCGKPENNIPDII